MTRPPVDRLPPGRHHVQTDADKAAIETFLSAIAEAQQLDRREVRSRAIETLGTDRCIDIVLQALTDARTRTEHGRLVPPCSPPTPCRWGP
jgi:hypothetical protein